MSNALPPFDSERLGRVRDALSSSPASIEHPVEALATPLRFVAFWTAIALPFLYFPLLAGGLTGSEPTVFVALLLANAVALVAGHDYHSADSA
ncbi:hypothetical protein [Halobellus rubicundus]|uniref:Acyl-CoA desaturase n=1 Tax=Halobellus rubicundus TaxID=2996466 RepID=A0ABD5MEI3_9EURY